MVEGVARCLKGVSSDLQASVHRQQDIQYPNHLPLDTKEEQSLSRPSLAHTWDFSILHLLWGQTPVRLQPSLKDLLLLHWHLQHYLHDVTSGETGSQQQWSCCCLCNV